MQTKGEQLSNNKTQQAEALRVPPFSGRIRGNDDRPLKGGTRNAFWVVRALRPERIVYAALLAVTAFWLGAIAAAPALVARGYISASLLLYQAFSVICHQLPERSFHLHGFPLGVCSRCTGIYAGFALGLLLYPLLRDLREERFPARAILVGAAVPMFVDVAGDWTGLFHNTFLSRVSTGALLGAVAAFYILPGLVGAFSDRATTQQASSPQPT